MLKAGEKLEGRSGGPVTVGKLLGTGGQGVVHEGRAAGGQAVAIKWYHPNFQRTDVRNRIAELVEWKAPSDHFLWPDDIVTRRNEFGYVMRLRPTEFVSLPRILSRKVNVTFHGLVHAAIQTVSAFKALQAKGLFYCDISDANLFVHRHSGDVLICDNDNVGSSRTRPPVLGTPRYMAPEIVRGEKEPSAITDQFSMAVLLFLLLFNDHPLQGLAETRIHVLDAKAMKWLYGTEPVFIFDPVNPHNRPVAGVHVNAPIFWGLYPEALKKVFTQAFTHGLREPGRRPTFSEWQSALSAVQDSIVVCQCGKQNFLDMTKPQVSCWKCKRVVQPPPRLVIDGKRTIMLNDDTKLYDHHLTPRGDPGAPSPARAQVVKHPTKGFLGLKNLGPSQWFLRVTGGPAQSVEPSRSVTVRDDTEITFGDVTGVIES